MPRDYSTVQNFIIYGVFDGQRLVYVGSSEKGLETVEHNHRHFREEFPHNPFESEFRLALEQHGKNWDFRILAIHMCSRATIEKFETIQINTSQPKYNNDMNPYGSSVHYGRITEDIDEYLDPVVSYVKQLS